MAKKSTPKTETKTEAKPAKVKVTKDRLLVGPRVYVRDVVLTVGDEIDADTAKQYKKNGWVADA